MTNEETEEKSENKTETAEIKIESGIEQRVERVEDEVSEAKSEIQKISNDLSSVVSELKKSIIDVRSAVSEIENPFNLLRAISSEKDLKNLNSERKRLGMKSLTLEKPEEEKEEEKPFKPPLPPSPEGEETPIEQITPPPVSKAGFGHLKWVWSLLDLGLTPKGITQLSEYCEHFGYLPPNSSEYISSLAYAANKAKKKGLDREQLMVSMYEAAMASGAKVELEDMNEIVSVALSGIKTRVRSE